jgi:hypothetical protein
LNYAYCCGFWNFPKALSLMNKVRSMCGKR